MKKQKKQIFDSREEPLYLNPGKFWYRLPQPFRLAFVSAFFLGLIVHLYIFSSLLLNHDSIHTIRTENNYLYLGRWSVKFLSSLSWIYETPVVIAVLTFLALALCAGLTVCILDIHSPACILLVSGFMVSFPTVACHFTYMATADAYFIAAFLHVAAVYITKKFRYGWIAAILCIAVGLGAYQAFIGCTVALFLLDCIVALFSDIPAKDTLKRGIAYIAVILAGLVLYRVIVAYFLWKNHMVLSDYKGISEAINSGILDYLRAIPLTYRQIILFFWSPSYLTRPLQLLQRAMFILAAGCFFFLSVLKRIYKDPLRMFLLTCCAVLLPMALNLICVICAGFTKVNMLMQYSYVFAYVFALKLFEMTALEVQPLCFGRARHTVVLSCLTICIALVWADFCVCNTGYLATQLSMEINQGMGIRILSRLEALEGYVPGKTPVMFVNNTVDIRRTEVASSYLAEMTGFPNTYIMLGQYAGPRTLSYLGGGGSILGASTEQCAAVFRSGILDSMSVFPAKDSIQIYNGIAIVKLSQ